MNKNITSIKHTFIKYYVLEFPIAHKKLGLLIKFETLQKEMHLKKNNAVKAKNIQQHRTQKEK